MTPTKEVPHRRRHPLRRVEIAALLLGLTLLTVWTYREAPDNGFHYDDLPNITRYEPVKQTDISPDALLLAAREPFIATRPLASLTFALDWARGGGHPKTFQFTNLLIHLLAS